MNIKNTDNHGITRWLKRIFSLEFLSVIIGLVGLYFAYDSFIKDKPGDLRFFNVEHVFSEDIHYIYYGFEMNGDSLDISSNVYIPRLINYSSNSINDLSVVALANNGTPFRPNGNYDVKVYGKDSSSISKITMALRNERIGYMGIIPFPIDRIALEYGEILTETISINYLYKGMEDEVKTVHVTLIGIPPEYKDDDGYAKSAEYSFIKAVRPYLLMMIEDYKEVAVMFENKTVEAPSKIDLLNESVIGVETIEELQ